MPLVETQILIADTPECIANCFPVIQELRPHLKDQKAFIEQVLRQNKQGYTLYYIQDEGEVGACMGMRSFEALAWGKLIYIDDLITRQKSRKRGFGRALLELAIEKGRREHYDQIHLDSGHHRHDAHRLYLKAGFMITCHHLALFLKDS